MTANIDYYLITVTAGKDTFLILSRLADIQSQLRVHTQLLQSVLQATHQHELLEACELPDGIVLPLKNLDDLRTLERKLENTETKSLMVSLHFWLKRRILLLHVSVIFR